MRAGCHARYRRAAQNILLLPACPKMTSGSSFILGKSPRGGYKQRMGCHRPQRASHSLAIGPAASRLSAGLLAANRSADPGRTAAQDTAGPPRRRGGRTAASPVLIKIEPKLSVGVVDEGCDVEIGRRVIPPRGSQLTTPAPEISGDEARESARTALLAAAATALCGSRPAASTPSRGAITSRGRPHSAAA